MAVMCNDRGLSFLDDDGQALNLNMDRSTFVHGLQEIHNKS